MIDTCNIRLGKIRADSETANIRLAECQFAQMIPDRTDAESGSPRRGAGQATRQTKDKNPPTLQGCQWAQADNAGSPGTNDAGLPLGDNGGFRGKRANHRERGGQLGQATCQASILRLSPNFPLTPSAAEGSNPQ